MAHRHDRAPHDDRQPDSAELGEAVQLDASDTLEGTNEVDALDAGYIPPDRPFGLDDDQVNGEFDTMDERLAREVPDDWDGGGDPTRSGRLVADGDGDDMDAEEVGIDGGAASAEEAAVHDVEIDTRVDGEPSVADDPAFADPEVDELIGDDVADEIRHAQQDAEQDGALRPLADGPRY
jgi:hypothetical protein